MENTRRFRDFAHESQNLDGEKIEIAKVFGKEILLEKYRTLPSRVFPGKDMVQLQFVLDGNRYVAFSTSSVIIRQIQTYEAELPFLTMLVKRGKYHTLS